MISDGDDDLFLVSIMLLPFLAKIKIDQLFIWDTELSRQQFFHNHQLDKLVLQKGRYLLVSV